MPDFFYVRYAPAVQAATAGTSLYPSVVLAQLALESGYGKSLLASKYHNYLGHKASSRWKGPTVRFSTPNDAQKVSTFRVYGSFAECLRAHVAILRSPLYRAAQQSPTAYAQALALAHIYAEDGGYATKLTGMMRRDGLTQYDQYSPAASGLLLGLLAAGAAAFSYRAELTKALGYKIK